MAAEMALLSKADFLGYKKIPVYAQCRDKLQPMSSFKQVIVVSHLWEDPSDPDPMGFQKSYLDAIVSDLKYSDSTGVFYDYSCLPQGDRTEEEVALFKSLLSQMNQLYYGALHPNTEVVLVNFTMRFVERAWLLFEFVLGSLGNCLTLEPFMSSQVSNMSMLEVFQLLKVHRRFQSAADSLPTSPSAAQAKTGGHMLATVVVNAENTRFVKMAYNPIELYGGRFPIINTTHPPPEDIAKIVKELCSSWAYRRRVEVCEMFIERSRATISGPAKKRKYLVPQALERKVTNFRSQNDAPRSEQKVSLQLSVLGYNVVLPYEETVEVFEWPQDIYNELIEEGIPAADLDLSLLTIPALLPKDLLIQSMLRDQPLSFRHLQDAIGVKFQADRSFHVPNYVTLIRQKAMEHFNDSPAELMQKLATFTKGAILHKLSIDLRYARVTNGSDIQKLQVMVRDLLGDGDLKL